MDVPFVTGRTGMDTLATLLEVMHNDPGDDTVRLALADSLEEAGQPDRAKLARLLAQLRLAPDAPQLRAREEGVRQLLAAGVEPCLPTRTNSIGIRFVHIPPGTFWMGSPPDEVGRFNDEEPLHQVCITRAFWLSVCPVTQQQFCRVMGENPSFFAPHNDGADRVRGIDTSTFPVESVSWDQAVHFCQELAACPQERTLGWRYRLPTEAEWEYACRGGIVTPTPYHVGDHLLPHHAKFDFGPETPDAEELPGETGPGSSGPRVYTPRPDPVGSYRPNGYGLYDMHGNIWEWCSDRFSETYYRRSPAADPTGPRRGSYHVLRGGSWFSRASVCRTACRNPVATPSATGFRLVLVS